MSAADSNPANVLLVTECIKVSKRGYQEPYEEMKQAALALAQTVIELREWVSDLHSGMYINCVYCGHRYGPKDKTPLTMADLLKQHIAQCPKHPMSELLEVLLSGRDLVGNSITHVSHGGPTRAEADQWITKAESAIARATGCAR